MAQFKRLTYGVFCSVRCKALDLGDSHPFCLKHQLEDETIRDVLPAVAGVAGTNAIIALSISNAIKTACRQKWQQLNMIRTGRPGLHYSTMLMEKSGIFSRLTDCKSEARSCPVQMLILLSVMRFHCGIFRLELPFIMLS